MNASTKCEIVDKSAAAFRLREREEKDRSIYLKVKEGEKIKRKYSRAFPLEDSSPF